MKQAVINPDYADRLLVISKHKSNFDGWKANNFEMIRKMGILSLVRCFQHSHILAYHGVQYVVLDMPEDIHPLAFDAFTDRNVKFAGAHEAA